jgi:NhaP-type Na+/H+ or K+/H+ antiporter
MFGFYVNLSGLIDMHSVMLAAAITAFLFIMRLIFFCIFIGKDSLKLVWFAPRGLITILLFMSVPDMFRIDIINEEVVTLVILMSIFVMMMGNMLPNKKESSDIQDDTETQSSLNSDP